ncbi:MAG: uracil phosphoribosyltransferase [Bacteroidales bacterium]|nr:uracil phosphoribosyltransferase [Bacteroidales bacterium]
MKVINLGENSSILNSIVAQLRDKEIQKDRAKFRDNLHRLGQIFGYEVSKTLGHGQISVNTPLGVARIEVPTDQVVVTTILRAGLPLQQGVLSVFDNADSAFITAYRAYDKDQNIQVFTSYCATPPLAGKTVILADTMLATGTSLLDGIRVLKEKGGEPARLCLVCPIASAKAIENLQKELSDDVTLWVATIDAELNSKFYIVPGLGDAGDLCFGEKL